MKCDLTDVEDVKSVFDRATKVADGGEVHILVNNAGMLIRQDSVDVGLEEWSQVRNPLGLLPASSLDSRDLTVITAGGDG